MLSMDGEAYGAICSCVDVTNRRESQRQLERQVTQRSEELSMLLDTARVLSSTLDLPTVLHSLVTRLQELVHYNIAAVFLSTGDNKLRLEHGVGFDTARYEHASYDLEARPQFQAVMGSRRPLVINSLSPGGPLARAFEDDPLRAQGGENPALSWMGLPLIMEDAPLGLIGLYSDRADAYGLGEVELSMAVASQAALAIQNARNYTEAQEAAALQERNRLARDLHDSLMQTLYGLRLGTSSARVYLARHDSGSLATAIGYINNLAKTALVELRGAILDLRPESVEGHGLLTVLESHSAVTEARHNVTIKLTAKDEPNLGLDAKEALYFVVREALQHAIVRGRASTIRIGLKETPELVTLSIRDNGTGFAEREQSIHFGLQTMRERMEAAGGSLAVSSARRGGMAVLASVPAGLQRTSAPPTPATS
jgi:signal transduction histidine kinase